jgi:hypothetical protein
MGLFDIFSNQDAQDAANAKIAGLNSGFDQASTAVNNGLSTATGLYNSALTPFNALSGTANNGYSAYADATGANGAAGNARALANFQSTPGYNFDLTQGLSAIDRGAAARGSLSSGGTLAAEQQYGTNLANQNYQQYVTNLSPYNTLAPGIANSTATINTNLGNLNYGAGTTLGNLAYNTQTGIGNANAAADMANYNASANMWGALMGGANLLAGGIGGGGGLSSLSSIFGGGSGSGIGK